MVHLGLLARVLQANKRLCSKHRLAAVVGVFEGHLQREGQGVVALAHSRRADCHVGLTGRVDTVPVPTITITCSELDLTGRSKHCFKSQLGGGPCTW